MIDNIWVFDCEVTAFDWLFVFKRFDEKEYVIAHNDSEMVRTFIEMHHPVLCGFNNKHYDQYILKGVMGGKAPTEVKGINDFIIGGGNGFDCQLLKGLQVPWFEQMDVMDDMQAGLSLKAIEGHLGMDIRESTISFDIDHEWDDQELAEMVYYCKHDVDATEEILRLRKGYFEAKIELGRMAGIAAAKAVYLTNAKLTAKYLNASRRDFFDEREYQLPPNVKLEYIPVCVMRFFARQSDPNISDQDLFSGKVEFHVGGCPTTVGFGGIHAALPCYREQAGGNRVIRNYDVASLYPSLMLECGYTSRAMADPEWYRQVYTTRIAAKKNGDKKTANTLKLVLNTTYGAMLDQFNDLYDPKMGRNVCVGGQMYILELAEHYVQAIKSLKLIQLNTDGLMVSLDRDDLPALEAINDEWQKRTHLNLEEDCIDRIIQKDVNNYVEVQVDGTCKCKGGYLTMGLSQAGAFNINNTANVVKKALQAYLADGIQPEDFIAGSNDPADYQLIAKAGSKYKRAYQIVDGVECDVQKVNRVFATTNPFLGKLYKVHRETGRTAQIESLPEHCEIHNDAMPDIEAIDKQWYIDLTWKRIRDFLGIEEPKTTKVRKPKMATTKTMNVHQRLLEARVKFLDAGVKKSGMNRMLSFKYFELDDIVPVATRIFREVGLLTSVSFSENAAMMTVFNVDEPTDCTSFCVEVKKAAENKGVTEIQSYGATITYTRRYLYMLALDITEPDVLDAQAGKDEPAPAAEATKKVPVAPAKPATPAQREEVKQELTAPDGPATELQVKQLKQALKKLKDKDEANVEFVSKVALETVSFTKITKNQCEQLMIEVGEKLEG